MATHFNIFAWRIPWTEEPGGLLPTGLHRVRHDGQTDRLSAPVLPACKELLFCLMLFDVVLFDAGLTMSVTVTGTQQALDTNLLNLSMDLIVGNFSVTEQAERGGKRQ